MHIDSSVSYRRIASHFSVCAQQRAKQLLTLLRVVWYAVINGSHLFTRTLTLHAVWQIEIAHTVVNGGLAQKPGMHTV